MKPRHQVSRTAIDLIKRFEGYRRKSAQLADGRWTIGYGHTLTARAGAEVSEQDAEALLLYDLIAVAHSVNEWTYTPLTQNQFDSLCAFAFNIGVDNFRRSSVLRRVNEGQLLQAACAMELWRKADFEGERIVIDALVRRRSAEKTLFLTPTHGWVPAPSPILRPNVDMDAAGAVPRQTPTALKAPMDGPRAIVERETDVVAPHAAPVLPLEAAAPVAVVTPHPAPPLVPVVPEEELSPTQTAAASVTSRLSTIFRDTTAEQPSAPAPVEPAPLAEPEAAAPPPVEAAPVEAAPVVPQPVPVEPTPAPPAAPIAMAAGDRAFVLTQPEESYEPAPVERPRLELPVAANESHPTLFDSQTSAANDQLGLPSPPQERRVYIDDTLEYDPAFDLLEPEQPKLSLPLLVGLTVVGLAFFAGGLFWAASVSPDRDGGLFNPMTVGWMAALAGIGFFGVAVYLMLDRLGRGDLDEEDDLDAE
ncbi:MAG: lysozyme [Phenylobacterium sp.]|uniref:lysozyme n=1 Tax=Phenylobacterium sp. TaxID=1871053 RepID=UPI001B3F51EB|nr:lysozyme [Phenylobacterium sp.]MBP7814987.1 lysozyme [Phenylobacterium sp.]MBP9230098.1 lysozyme [Phenylobacterium sp.]